jgi:hypothetical protein
MRSDKNVGVRGKLKMDEIQNQIKRVDLNGFGMLKECMSIEYQKR